MEVRREVKQQDGRTQSAISCRSKWNAEKNSTSNSSFGELISCMSQFYCSTVGFFGWYTDSLILRLSVSCFTGQSLGVEFALFRNSPSLCGELPESAEVGSPSPSALLKPSHCSKCCGSCYRGNRFVECL